MKTVLFFILCFWTSFAFADGVFPPTSLDNANVYAMICYVFILFYLLLSGFLLLIRRCFLLLIHRKSKDTQKIPLWLAYTFFVFLSQIFINLSFFIVVFISTFLPKNQSLVVSYLMLFFILISFVMPCIALFFLLKRKLPQKRWVRRLLPVFHFFLSVVLLVLTYQIFNL